MPGRAASAAVTAVSAEPAVSAAPAGGRSRNREKVGRFHFRDRIRARAARTALTALAALTTCAPDVSGVNRDSGVRHLSVEREIDCSRHTTDRAVSTRAALRAVASGTAGYGCRRCGGDGRKRDRQDDERNGQRDRSAARAPLTAGATLARRTGPAANGGDGYGGCGGVDSGKAQRFHDVSACIPGIPVRRGPDARVLGRGDEVDRPRRQQIHLDTVDGDRVGIACIEIPVATGRVADRVLGSHRVLFRGDGIEPEIAERIADDLTGQDAHQFLCFNGKVCGISLRSDNGEAEFGRIRIVGVDARRQPGDLRVDRIRHLLERVSAGDATKAIGRLEEGDGKGNAVLIRTRDGEGRAIIDQIGRRRCRRRVDDLRFDRTGKARDLDRESVRGHGARIVIAHRRDARLIGVNRRDRA